MPEPKPEAVIAKAIAAVRADCGLIPKDGFNSFHRYAYVSESALVAHLQPLLDKHGLVILPSVALDPAPRVDEVGVTHLVMEFTIAHTSGAVWPEKFRIFASGNDRDSKGGYGDKGAYKANTGGFKYFLNRLFMVATGDDPELDAKESPTPKPKPKAPQAPGGGPAHGAKPATEQQLKMLGAKASARADVILDAMLVAGRVPVERLMKREAVKDEIRKLAKARSGCGEEIKGVEVTALMRCIENAIFNDDGEIEIALDGSMAE